jgi:hypothetical protein
MASHNDSYAEYKAISDDIIDTIATKYSWIADPINQATTYVRTLPYFEFIESMQSHLQFKESATQLYFHSATFPKVMGLMLGMTSLSENHMMSFYAGHASGEATHHKMLFNWMLKFGLIEDFSEIENVITTPETNACVNLAYQMAVEQDRSKWLVALNCGIEKCSNDFFKAVAPKMHNLGVGDRYFDIHVEADEHHSIMGLEYIPNDLSDHRKSVLIAKALEGITLWAAMLHSWIGISTFPVFNEYGGLASRRCLYPN